MLGPVLRQKPIHGVFLNFWETSNLPAMAIPKPVIGALFKTGLAHHCAAWQTQHLKKRDKIPRRPSKKGVIHLWGL
jgi:hypothetical protein